MALSGSVSTDSYSGRYLKLSWTATQDIASNTSTVKWELKGAGTASSSWYKAGNFYVKINGKVVYEKDSDYRIKLYNGTEVASGSIKITHTTDGSKSFSVAVKGGIYTYARNVSGSKTFTLNQIPRAATITSAPNFTDEGNPVLKYSNPAGSSATTLQACIASSDGSTIYAAYRNISKTGSSYTFNLTTTEREALRKACVNAKSMTVRFYVKTDIGGETYRKYLGKTLTITNATPTASIDAEATDELSISLLGTSQAMIKGISDIKYTITASAKKHATIKSYKVVNGSASKTTATGTFTNATNNSFEATITDSRGYSIYTEFQFGSVVNYVAPTATLKVSNVSVEGRFDLSFSGNYYTGTFLSNPNSITVEYRYKVNDGEYGAYIPVSGVNASNNKYSASLTVEELDYHNVYTVQYRIKDKIKTITSNTVVVRFLPLFDWGEGDFHFNVPIHLANAKQIYGTTTEDEPIIMASLNTSNQMFFGYGGYANEIGTTFFDGNAVGIRSKGNIMNTAAGTIGGNKAWTNSSDARLKKNIEDIPAIYGDIWLELTPRIFEWNELNYGDGKKQFGLIAQEAIEIFNKYGVDYNDLGFISPISIDDTDYFAITYEHYHMLTAFVLKNTINELVLLKEKVQALGG